MGKIETRLKNVLIKDKYIKSDGLNEVIKSDMIDVLKNYLIFDEENVDLKIETEEERIFFKCKILCDKIKSLNYLK